MFLSILLFLQAINYDAETRTLTVEKKEYQLNRNVFVVGFGKAVLGMARVVEDILGDHIRKGILSIPVGAKDDYLRRGKT